MVERKSNVVALRPPAARRRVFWRKITYPLSDGFEALGQAAIGCALVMIHVALGLARWSLAALLVLMEPFVRVVLMVPAFGCFFVTVVFGFVGHAPHFPKWGMLAFSIGCVLLYWGFLCVMMLMMGGARGRH